MEGRKNGNSFKRGAESQNGKSIEMKKKAMKSLINEKLLEEGFITEISEAYRSRVEYSKDDKSLQIINYPYHCCVVQDFIRDRDFLEGLQSDLLSLEFHEKSNDLYKFLQSDDLKTSNTYSIQNLRSILYRDFLSWLRSVTGLELNDTMDLSCAQYKYTDTLLCHDDELEGRRIAFIFYLVPPWEEKDGGSLDLFAVDEDGSPSEIKKKLIPKWNTLVFFEVTPISFHQVSEVLSKEKCRLSVSGWFYGESVPRPLAKSELKLTAESPRDEEDDILLNWINPMYLNPEIVESIQEQLEENSEIQLDEFLIEEKYDEILKELRGTSIRWRAKGPANKRHYKALEDNSEFPPNLKSLVELMRSLPMFKLLTKLTGLNLTDLESEESLQENPATSTREMGNGNESNASCTFEIRHWSHGSYTLMHDSDPGMQEFALDAMLFFGCDDWDADVGGSTTYIARAEDEELLTVCPTSNCLALVYRDKETMRFVKHVNASSEEAKHENESNSAQGFYDLSMVYYE